MSGGSSLSVILATVAVAVSVGACRQTAEPVSIHTSTPQAAITPPALEFATATPEEARAIAAAERFVAENGYTAAPANQDRMVPELQQGGLPKPIIEKIRHDTLKPHAYGVSPEQGLHGPGWTVFFEFTRATDTLAGVEMSPDLRRVWMSHYELRADAPVKVLRRRTNRDAPSR